jgi:serine/threonine-protein kinase RsbW
MNQLYRELTISSSLSNIYKIEKFVEEICDAYYITNSYFGNILLSVEEAVKNAIIHGNKSDKRKNVRISFRRIPNGLSFTVTDQGDGFDLLDIPNPISGKSETKTQGTGIFLIRSLSDKVSFNAPGNQVEIVFYISSISQETTLNRINRVNQYFLTQKSLADR